MAAHAHLTRKQLHAALDEYLDECGYGEEIPMEFGSLKVDVQIEHSEVTAIIGERFIKRKRQLRSVPAPPGG